MTAAGKQVLAARARSIYIDALVHGIEGLDELLSDAAAEMLLQPAPYPVMVERRDAVQAWMRCGPDWIAACINRLRLLELVADSGEDQLSANSSELALVEPARIDREIANTQLVEAMVEGADWEFSLLRSRMQLLESRASLAPQDLLQARVLAGLLLEAWTRSGLDASAWQVLQALLHDKLALLLCSAYREMNIWLLAQQSELDLRPFVRRAPQADQTHAAIARKLANQGAQLLHRLQQAISRQVPGFDAMTLQGFADTRPASPRLAAAIQHEQDMAWRETVIEVRLQDMPVSQQLLELKTRSQSSRRLLKSAADTPAERAAVEIVAMMFQSILAEERIPPALRLWFSRLQMPTLRVALSEPDFFASVDHPARSLIDRMGACVMSFHLASNFISDAVAGEIKRVVQVVEAYPETGRRVFQMVLNEFETFLGRYFEFDNPASRRGVSLAQQVEQREALTIQSMIMLRRMLDQVPVPAGVRGFLFRVWAEVLAAATARNDCALTLRLQRAAADLIWSVSAKATPQERAEVLSRLPALLKTLRAGMTLAGMSAERQEEQTQLINKALAAAFTAQTAATPPMSLADLLTRLETLELSLPGAGPDAIAAVSPDLSAYEAAGFEVVAEAAESAAPAMLAWAGELQLGSWHGLEYRGSSEQVQLAWRGQRQQLALFVTPQGRNILFSLGSIATFLQAGLLLPELEEALTVRATRNALSKLEADPGRLLG